MLTMAKRCHGYNSVNHHNFESKFCSEHTQNDKLGDSNTYLNVVFTPENKLLNCVFTEQDKALKVELATKFNSSLYAAL